MVRQNPNFRAADARTTDAARKRFFPPLFAWATTPSANGMGRSLKVLTEQQQKWVFNLEPGKNYLLYAPGSGKTNVLISRALHLFQQAPRGALPTILLTTYSENLATNISAHPRRQA